MPFFLISFSHPEDGKPLIACARSILNEVVGRFEEGEQKLECLAGAEFEVSSVSLEPADWYQEANSPVYPLYIAVLPILRDCSLGSREGTCQPERTDSR